MLRPKREGAVERTPGYGAAALFQACGEAADPKIGGPRYPVSQIGLGTKVWSSQALAEAGAARRSSAQFLIS